MNDVRVTGGAEGIQARTDDITLMAHLFDLAVLHVERTIDELNHLGVRYLLDVEPELQGRLARELGASGHLASAAEQLRLGARRLRFYSSSIEMVDDDVGSVAGSLFGRATDVAQHGYEAQRRLSEASVLADIAGVRDGWGAGISTFIATDPDPLDWLAGAGATRGSTRLAAELLDDGHPVVTAQGPDLRPVTVRAPTSLRSLVDALAVRDEGAPGEISVSHLTGADGRSRWIVDLPGTKSWNPLPNRDPTSVVADLRAIDGQPTTYQRGVLTAMADAGVGPGDDVMLVGHSEGGMVAANIAHDVAASHRFRVTHVVTAGSPIGRTAARVPASVQVLALENDADIVPKLDGCANPPRPDITTVVTDEQHYSVEANHSLTQSYRAAADAADRSDDPSIRAFTTSAGGFLDGSATMSTEVFRVSRG